MKDDSGSYAVFTEQRSSASQKTAANVMDVVSSGERSICLPRPKWNTHHHCFKIPKSECPDIWIRLPKHKWPNSWSSMEGPAVPLERNLYGHPLARLLWERQFEKVLFKIRLVKSFKLGMFIR